MAHEIEVDLHVEESASVTATPLLRHFIGIEYTTHRDLSSLCVSAPLVQPTDGVLTSQPACIDYITT
jgi:hypothetical protein